MIFYFSLRISICIYLARKISVPRYRYRQGHWIDTDHSIEFLPARANRMNSVRVLLVCSWFCVKLRLLLAICYSTGININVGSLHVSAFIFVIHIRGRQQHDNFKKKHVQLKRITEVSAVFVWKVLTWYIYINIYMYTLGKVLTSFKQNASIFSFSEKLGKLIVAQQWTC